MSQLIQYDLFKEKPSEIEICKIEVEEIRKSCDKVRKGIYAKHGELAKMFLDLNMRLDNIERHLCKKENNGMV